MSTSTSMSVDLPDTGSAIRKALDGERRKLHGWAAGLVKEIEAQRDRGLLSLDRTEAALVGNGDVVVKPTGRGSRSHRGRRRPTVAAQAESRRQAIHRLLVERGRAMSFSEIRTALRLSEFSTRSALKRLIEEGKVVRTGTRATTRYTARDDEAGVAVIVPTTGHDMGTRQGRILELIEDRGSASADELVQALRVPMEEIRTACGALLCEEEIRMASRNGRPVYTTGQVAA
jgi:hypothetical protein